MTSANRPSVPTTISRLADDETDQDIAAEPVVASANERPHHDAERLGGDRLEEDRRQAVKLDDVEEAPVRAGRAREERRILVPEDRSP